MKKYVGDFETATWIDDETYVWAWACCEIGNETNIKYGNNIDSFFEFIIQEKNPEIYFHNLKFDGEFIIYYLLNNGFEVIEDKKDRKDKTFTTLISDLGMFYSIEVYFKVGNKSVKKVKFLDSLKIIPFSVDQIAKSFNLEISKLTLDYNKPRSRNHILTPEEKDYITNDVVIVSKALNVLMNENLRKMTAGSNALSDFKTIINKFRFKHYFPELTPEADSDIRKAYKGGFTYLNPYYKNKIVGNGVVLDVNSLYPSIMRSKRLLPFGEGIFFEGKYEYDKSYPLCIQSLTCSFEIKKDKIPTIQLKENHYKWKFMPNEYIESSKNEVVNLCLTNVDLKLFFEHYNVYDLKYLNGWKFKGVSGIFNEYIDKWIKVKNESTISGNKQMRSLAKLMLNSLYGKFATSLKAKSKIPYLENDVVHYTITEEKDKKGLYIPIGAFITSYAREVTIRTSQKIKDYSIKKYGEDLYCYSDTDSIHTLLPIEELKLFCDIDDVELGKWKHESSFSEAKFVRQKCYIEKFNDEYNIVCAGLPKKCMYKKEGFNNLFYKRLEETKEGKIEEVEHEFNIKDFEVGFTASGKLTYKHVKGGVKLVNTEFSIKEAFKPFLKN